ncbi:MAG TPA: TlpA disulfide reductase family protein [Niabella sp.]
MKNILLIVGLFSFTSNFAQSNLIITPEHPQSGEEIKFTYLPGGELEGTDKAPSAYMIKMGSKGYELQDVPLKKEQDRFTGTVATDTSVRLIAFGFAIDDKKDNNADSGYLVPLYKNGSIQPQAYSYMAAFYNGVGAAQFGVKSAPQKALEYYKTEIANYPDKKEEVIISYLQTLLRSDKEKGSAAIQSEIEQTLKSGLKTAADYSKIITLYALLRLPQQQRFFSQLKKEKFPDEKLTMQEYYEKFNAAADADRKEAVIAEVTAAAAAEKDPSSYNSFIGMLQSRVLSAYAEKKDWEQFKRYAAQIKDPSVKMAAYNAAAWKMQQDSSNLPFAAELSEQTVTYAKAELRHPTASKPKMMLNKDWEEQRQNNFATFADTYGMVLYKLGRYKEGLPYSKEAALTIAKGQNTDENSTYALLAEKVLAPKKYKPQLEQFVKDGKANAVIRDILKTTYLRENKSDAGYDQYLTALEQDARLKMIEKLKKEKLNNAAPKFVLNDLSGNRVSIEDLKGKIVIVDFWATWCGPCKASFPAMNKMVHKYKDNPDIRFLFVDTWENTDDKQKNAADFIAQTKYDFHVLLDNESKVVSQFDVPGIPTKFVIGKDGNIKFKAVGFDGDQLLEQELEAMIELAD